MKWETSHDKMRYCFVSQCNLIVDYYMGSLLEACLKWSLGGLQLFRGSFFGSRGHSLATMLTLK